MGGAGGALRVVEAFVVAFRGPRSGGRDEGSGSELQASRQLGQETALGRVERGNDGAICGGLVERGLSCGCTSVLCGGRAVTVQFKRDVWMSERSSDGLPVTGSWGHRVGLLLMCFVILPKPGSRGFQLFDPAQCH